MSPPLFGYQEYAKQKIVKRGRTAVIAPPGAGKTRPIIEGMKEREAFTQAVLILCTGSAIATWVRQIPQWLECPEYSDFIFVVRGDRGDRLDLWKQAKRENYGTYITNYNLFYRDYGAICQHGWTTIIADEYHKVMRSHKVADKGRKKTYGLFKSLTLHTPNLALASGSLVRRNAASMFTAFQSVAPKTFSSYWRFVNTFCHVDDSTFGKRVYGVKNIEALKKVMDEYLAYIPAEVVADQLPEGRRVAIDVELTPEQVRVYKELEKDMISFVGDNMLIAGTILTKLTMLRQLLCCPRILSPELGLGASYEAVVDRLDMDAHVIIFVPYRDACDYFQADLKQRGYKCVEILRGGTDDVEQARILRKVKNEGGILLCTIQYAESFDMETVCTSYFIGYDLTVDQNEQAEGRTRRAISEHKFVTWNYLRTDTPVDDHFIGKLGDDARTANLILGRPEEFIARLKQRREPTK